jgi:hypothetical protein
MTTICTQVRDDRFYVVHPLDEEPEQKMSPDGLGTMPMSPSVRVSLVALRGYAVFIIALAFYRLATLGVAVIHHAR